MPEFGKNGSNQCAMVDLGGVGVWAITIKHNQHVFFSKNVFFFFFFEISRNRLNSLNISPILAKMAAFDSPRLKIGGVQVLPLVLPVFLGWFPSLHLL